MARTKKTLPEDNAPGADQQARIVEAAARLFIAHGYHGVSYLNIAKELGIRVAGTAAVIGFAKQQVLIASAKDCFASLHASDFRISKEVIQAVLSQVGEA